MESRPQTVLVLGVDGYTGFPLSVRLLRDGYDVVGGDHFFRRSKADSVTPIASPNQRMAAVRNHLDVRGDYYWVPIDATDYSAVRELVRYVDPDAVVNLAQIPSAPYSMRDATSAWVVQENNVRGSLNLFWALRDLGKTDTHVVQLATMGEYGVYPEGRPIPEGFTEEGLPAPKDPGSYYHISKAQATANTFFAAKTWGVPTTEVYQGIVYGVTPFDGDADLREAAFEDPRLLTRFDVDDVWGTVINRFTAQAVAGKELTVYGDGTQQRAILPLSECVECLSLALANPPTPEEDDHYPYRAVNQFGEVYRIKDLAEAVAYESGLGGEIDHLYPNPRGDDFEHSYDPDREALDRLGYEPGRSVLSTVRETADVIEQHQHRLPNDFRPTIDWS